MNKLFVNQSKMVHKNNKWNISKEKGSWWPEIDFVFNSQYSDVGFDLSLGPIALAVASAPLLIALFAPDFALDAAFDAAVEAALPRRSLFLSFEMPNSTSCFRCDFAAALLAGIDARPLATLIAE